MDFVHGSISHPSSSKGTLKTSLCTICPSVFLRSWELSTHFHINQVVSYKEVSDIDFSCPNTSETNAPGPEKKKEVPPSTPTGIELQDFCGKLISLSKSKQTILSLVHPCYQIQEIYHQVMSELYEPHIVELQ